MKELLEEQLEKLDSAEQEKSELAVRVSQSEEKRGASEEQVKLLEERLSEQALVSAVISA